MEVPSPAPAGLRGRLLAVIRESTVGLGLEPRLQLAGPIDTIDDRIAYQLLPVLREALSNVVHHADASNVRVIIAADESVTLSVMDDGVGVPDEVLGGRGISNMTERARNLGGNLTLAVQPSGGSLLTWQVPTNPARVDLHPTRNGSEGAPATT